MKKSNLKQKTNPVYIILLSAILFFTACQDDDLHIIPSSQITTAEIPVSEFSGIQVSDAFKIIVTFSETEESVMLEANANLHQQINIQNTGENLRIGLYKNTSISGKAVMNVYIKTKSLNLIQAMGASIVELQNPLVGQALELSLEGACIVKGQLEVEEINANIIGASILDLTGNSKQFSVRAEGASIMTGFAYKTDNLNAYIYGASNVSLTVNQEINVTASGASMLIYKGNGTIKHQKLSDTSKVVHLN